MKHEARRSRSDVPGCAGSRRGGVAALWSCALRVTICIVVVGAAPHTVHAAGKDGKRTSRLSDDAVPQIDPDSIPARPKPILELGNPFLGTGNIQPGIDLPGGAVWQPSLLVFGTYRTAWQSFNNGQETFGDWANRLDLFANVQLSGTERVLVGIRPFDEDGRFTGYNYEPNENDGWQDETNIELTTLFFEGDIGELIPDADPQDFGSGDLGFSVGRQPLLYQEGMLINDTIDAVGITRNTLLPSGGSDLQFTFIYGWNEIHRDDNIDADDAQLFGLFIAADYPQSTYNVDFVYVYDDEDAEDDGGGDGVYWAVSSVQRIDHLNVSMRVLGSQALDEETDAVSSGHLLFGELSWVPPWTHDNVYINAFLGIDNFASAARAPDTGGPLGRTGILFAAVGLGRYGTPLGNRADESVGAAVGYQLFLDETRRQLIFEFGGRESTESDGDGELALGGRFQQAIGQHAVLQFDVFGSFQESRDESVGGRVELRFEF